MSKGEKIQAFRRSGPSIFKYLAHFFGVFKMLSYCSYIFVGWHAYLGNISWWWLIACFTASLLFEYLSRASVHSHLMTQGYHYYGVEGATQNGFDGTVRGINDIVSKFGAVMETHDWLTTFYDTNVLPFEKEEIRKAIFVCYYLEKDQEKKELLKTALLALTHFQNNIGHTPIKTVIKDSITKYNTISNVNDENMDHENLYHLVKDILAESADIESSKASELSSLADAEFKMYLNMLERQVL